MKTLPLTEKERLKIPREYICNVVFTIASQAFQDWVDAKIEARNNKVKSCKNLANEMGPDTARIFKRSSSINRK